MSSKKWIQNLAPDFNPNQFDDPLANDISWTLTHEKFSSNRMQDFERSEADHLRVSPRRKMPTSLLSYAIFAGFFMGLLASLMGQKDFYVVTFSLFLLSLFYLRSKYCYCVFDIKNRLVLQFIENKSGSTTTRIKKEVARFSDIHAVQILDKASPSGDGVSSRAIELNLVLNDKSRFFVTDMEFDDTAKNNAAFLAKEMNLPLWDATP